MLSLSFSLSIYRCTCISVHLLVELSFQCNFISVFCEFFMSKCVLHSNDCRLHMRIGNSICMPIANLKNLLSRLIESYLFEQNWHKYFMCIIIRLNFTFLLWWLMTSSKIENFGIPNESIIQASVQWSFLPEIAAQYIWRVLIWNHKQNLKKPKKNAFLKVSRLKFKFNIIRLLSTSWYFYVSITFIISFKIQTTLHVGLISFILY